MRFGLLIASIILLIIAIVLLVLHFVIGIDIFWYTLPLACAIITNLILGIYNLKRKKIKDPNHI